MIWLLAIGVGACVGGLVWISYHYGKYVGQHQERRRREDFARTRRITVSRLVVTSIGRQMGRGN